MLFVVGFALCQSFAVFLTLQKQHFLFQFVLKDYIHIFP